MKVNRNELLGMMRQVENSFVRLSVFSETVDFNKIPNSELEILKERVDLVNRAIIDLFDRLNKYEE
jgi:hypothetical protein